MKRLYETPAIEIARFEFENIMTESGVTPPPTTPGTSLSGSDWNQISGTEEGNAVIANLQSESYVVTPFDNSTFQGW